MCYYKYDKEVSFMQSRMNKYYDEEREIEEENVSLRTKRNQDLYKEVSSLELEDFDLNSNVSVIGNNTDNINLDEIKDILDKKYHENPRKKSFGDTEEISLPKINLDETREYDINSILMQAKEKKEINYEEERLKKIRNTQYDILKSLDLMSDEEDIEEDIDEIEEKKEESVPISTEKTEKELKDLIDTITAKELIKNESELTVTGELDPLDILSDLRGDDDSTKVMGMHLQELVDPLNEVETNKKTKTSVLERNKKKEQMEEEPILEKIEIAKADKKEEDLITEDLRVDKIALESKNYKSQKTNLYDSFIGKTTTFTQSDFDDFNDLKEDMHITKIIIKLLIFLIVVLFIVGVVVLLNKQLGLGLF